MEEQPIVIQVPKQQDLKPDLNMSPGSHLWLVFYILLILKLAGPQADLSWWWVTAPIWGAWLLAFLVAIPVFFAAKRKQKKEIDNGIEGLLRSLQMGGDK